VYENTRNNDEMTTKNNDVSYQFADIFAQLMGKTHEFQALLSRIARF